MIDLAIAQYEPRKAAPEDSLESIGEVLRRATSGDRSADLVLFPEASLTGYDLEGGVRECARTATWVDRRLQEVWAAGGSDGVVDVALGFYERHDGHLYNSLLYTQLGGRDPGIRRVHRKVFLPTYGVFRESRFLDAGSGVRAFDTRWGRVACLVCEDLFHSLLPTVAALQGAELILVSSAAPARGAGPGGRGPDSAKTWDRIARRTASEHGVYVAVSQMVGSEGGKAYAGPALLAGPDGRILRRAPLFDEHLLAARLDREQIFLARRDEPLLADLREALPRVLENSPLAPPEEWADPAVAPGGETAGKADAEEDDDGGVTAQTPAHREARAPGGDPEAAGAPDPDDRSPLEIDPELVEQWLVRFLRREVREQRGFDRAVLALSGGVDSATSLGLAARALGPENVTALWLPTETNRPESREDAEEVAETFWVDLEEIDISDAVEGYVRGQEPEISDRRRGNVAARTRMIVLYDQSVALDALPIGTGNKSERLLGYFTWHADDAPPVNPLGDLFKCQVRTLARHLGVPEGVVEKPPSAGLVEGQTDEGDLGVTYDEADLILHHLIRGERPERLVECGFDAEAVEIVHRRLEGTHWKRRPPTVAMVSDSAIGEGYLRPVDYPPPGRR